MSDNDLGEALQRMLDGARENTIVSIWRMRDTWRVERRRGISLTESVAEDEDLVTALSRAATCMGK